MIQRLKKLRSLTGLQRVLLFSVSFSCGLLTLRMLITHEWRFVFLTWNVFLAYIPYGISSWLMRHPERTNRLYIFIPVSLLWLLWVPNSFYIITDLFHFNEVPGAPQWLDLPLLFSFAWNGLLPGFLSLSQMETICTQVFRLRNKYFFLIPVLSLISLGVYIGRYLRYNSWDIIISPFDLSADILCLGVHPLRNSAAWGMMICFFGLLVLLYGGVKKLAEQ